jgi:hypothetical protein
MKTHLAAFALAATLAQPAAAVTFPGLTTIYVMAGVKDSGNIAENVGVATAIQCSNVSGVTTDIRFLVLSATGSVLGSSTAMNVPHGWTIERSTHLTAAFTSEGPPLIAGIPLSSGVVNIESLQSGVFCTAAIIDASTVAPDGVTPHIVRVNPHPGTVE